MDEYDNIGRGSDIVNFFPEIPNGMMIPYNNNNMVNNSVNNIFNKFNELENRIKRLEQRIARLENESNNNNNYGYNEPDNTLYMI